ncbi:MAG: hypothetical protein COA74_04695 [Gammaproteobacteria bacterium]|nr:MAG: hypothetical protein COA74_04695 [Gammaproteobacteria bacterium]
MYGQDRDKLRGIWFESWQNYRDKKTLIPLHQELVNIIKLHPEYQLIFDNPEQYLGKEYLPEFGETNPFLHLSMHQGMHEQLSSNRPTGIREVYANLCKKIGDPHDTEHAMMEAFAETLWQAQRSATLPDEDQYLARLKKML